MNSFQLRLRPTTTDEMLSVFGDRATLRHALNFESALAQALAAEKLIDAASAEAIEKVCGVFTVDFEELAAGAALAGTLAIPLVSALRARLSGDAALALHRGATSQDLSDSVLMIQVREAGALLSHDLERIVRALGTTAEQFAALPAVGRTLLQDARPIGFGLRIAQWAKGVEQSASALDETISKHCKIQFGGAVGARGDLLGRGAAVAAQLAQRMGLKLSPPWHSRRVGPASIAASLGIVVGALGKMARDVSLLAQNRVAEATEPLIEGRGGSSSMPHKQNPTACQIALSAATRAPSLVAAALAAMPGEEERGLGGWQAEAGVLADLCLLAGGSARAMAEVAEGLVIHERAIARNLVESSLGSDIGESVVLVRELLDEREE